LKPSAVRSRSYRASIAPTNKSTFSPGDQAIFYVPGGRRNTYLDTSQTYIRFTIKNNDTTASTSATAQSTFFLDNNASCVFNRLDIFHASNLLESVQQYNMAMNYVLDCNMTPAQRIGLSAAYGTNPNMAMTVVDVSRQGTQLYGTAWNAVLTTPASVIVNQQQTFCMPILSGVIGLGSDKFLPIGKLADDVRLEWTIEQQNIAVCYTNAVVAAGWTITDFQLELCIVELSDEGENMVNSMISPEHPIYLHGNSYRHYVSTLPAGSSGNFSTLVPARFGSLKSLIVQPRRSTEIGAAGSYSLGSRINPNISQYWWRIGSSLIPAKPVVLENSNSTGGFAEAFIEMQRSWHSVSSAANSSSLPAVIYNVSDQGTVFANSAAISTINTVGVNPISTGISSFRNGFVIAQEMESFALRNDVLLSGYNTLSQQIFFEFTQQVAIGATNYTLDMYAAFDMILVLDSGILSVRF